MFYIGEAGEKVQKWEAESARKREKERWARLRASAAPGSFDAMPAWRQGAYMAVGAVMFGGLAIGGLVAVDVAVGLFAYGFWAAWESGYLLFYAGVLAAMAVDGLFRARRHRRETQEALDRQEKALMQRHEAQMRAERKSREPKPWYSDMYDGDEI